MKKIVCLVAFVCIATALHAEPRAFTSTDGKTIQAELLGANGLQATIKLADGRETVVPLNRLSAADQSYIADWVKQNPQAIRYNFAVDATKDKVESGSKRTGSSIESSTANQWLYRVKVTNRASQAVDGIKLRYQIHYVDVDGKSKNEEFKSGVKDVPALKAGESVNVDTDPVELVTTKLEGGWMYTDGSRSRQTDTIKGIAVTLEHNGKGVFEYTSGNVKKVAESQGSPAGKSKLGL